MAFLLCELLYVFSTFSQHQMFYHKIRIHILANYVFAHASFVMLYC